MKMRMRIFWQYFLAWTMYIVLSMMCHQWQWLDRAVSNLMLIAFMGFVSFFGFLLLGTTSDPWSQQTKTTFLGMPPRFALLWIDTMLKNTPDETMLEMKAELRAAFEDKIFLKEFLARCLAVPMFISVFVVSIVYWMFCPALWVGYKIYEICKKCKTARF